MATRIVGTFTITVKGDSLDKSTVEARSPDKTKVPPQPLRLPFEQLETMDALSKAQSHVSDATLKIIGQALYTAIFTPSILSALADAKAKTKANEGIRIRFVIGSPSLLNWPWELMHDGESLIATRGDYPFVRSLPQSQDIRLIKQLQVRGALRILFVGASPCDLDPLKIEDAAAQLQQLLAEPLRKKQLVLEILLNPTLKEFHDKMLENFHILYFAGHGTATEIFLDDGEGEIDEKTGRRDAGYSHPISAQTLGPLLKDKPIRLVFLAACNTASAASDPLSGFAYNLLCTSNVPAIVAMQFFIGNEAANNLTGHFLKAIAAFQPVDAALAEARKALIIQGKITRDAVTPIMYLQAEDSALFRPTINWAARGLGATLLIILSLVLVFWGVLRFYWDFSTQKVGSDLSQQAATTFDEGNNRLGLLLAVAGYHLNPTAATLAQVNSLVGRVDDHLIRYLYPTPDSDPTFYGLSTNTVALAADPTTSSLAWSDGNHITLWMPDTTISRQFNGLKTITSLAFDPTGHYLAGGSNQGEIMVWSADTGVVVWGPSQYWNHSAPINELTFSPDGTHLAAASCAFALNDTQCTQGFVLIWDMNAMKQNYASSNNDPAADEWLLDSNAAAHVAFSPDGHWLAAVSTGSSENDRFYIWDRISGEKRTVGLPTSTKVPIGLTFTSDSTSLVIGVGDTLTVWNTAEASSQSFSIGANITVLTTGSEGPMVIVADERKDITLWNITTQSQVGLPLVGHQQPITFLATDQNGQRLLSGGMQDQKPSEFILWSMASSERQKLMLSHVPEPLYDLVVDTNGGSWAAVGGDGKLIHRSISGIYGDQTSLSLPDAVKGIAIGTDLTQVAIYYHGSTTQYPLVAQRINLSSGKKIEKQSTRSIDFTSFDPLRPNTAFDPAGHYIGLVSAAYAGIGFWNLGSNSLPDPPDTKLYSITALAFGPKRPADANLSLNVPWTATGDEQGQVVFWDPMMGKPIGDAVIHHTTAITSLVFSPDGQWLASGSVNGNIRLQNLQTNTLVEPLLAVPQSTSQISALAFSADSHLLASGKTNDQIVIWDIEQTPVRITNTLSTEGQPIRLAFLDSSTLIVGNKDGIIIRWKIGDFDSLTQACSIVNRSMHPVERDAQITPALNDIFLSQFLSTSVRGETPCVSTQSN